MLGRPILLPVLLAATPQGPPPVGVAQVSVHARVALDEAARTLRGSVVLRVRRTPGDTASSVTLDPGASHRSAVQVNGEAVAGASAGGGAARIVIPFSPAADSVTVELLVTADDRSSASAHAAVPRAFAFRSWLPRVVAPAPWPHPVLADYLVVMDVPEDQVLGATGTPLCGDPGWAAARWPPGAPVTPARSDPDSLRDPVAAGAARGDCPAAAAGRKSVVWYAEDVPDFALVLDPGFRYEEGDFLERPVRALYRRDAVRTWGAEVTVAHTESALAWLEETFDRPVYPWPQWTTVQGLDSLGVAEPMLATVPSVDRAAILDAWARVYLAGAVAVAPTDTVWLVRGLAGYVADTYLETQGRSGIYRRLERAILDDELDGRAGPVLPAAPAAGEPGDERRATFLFHQLRAILGDQVMRDVLAAYWHRAALGEGDEALFRAAADAVAGGDVDPLLDRLLRDTAPTDYALGAVRRVALDTGGWRTTAEVVRRAPDRVPLAVEVVADSEVVGAVAAGGQLRDTVILTTRTRPRRVILDPDARSHDWNMLNNRRAFGLGLGRSATASDYLDTWFTRRSARDRLTVGWAPVAWYDDAGGWTVGVRRRTDYLGRFDLDESWLSVATGLGARGTRHDVDARIVVRNPTWLQAPGTGEWLELGLVEGRQLAGLGVGRTGVRTAGSLAVRWLRTATMAYLDSTRWDDAATLEVTAAARAWTEGRHGRLAARLTLTGGRFALRDPAGGAARRGAYARLSGEATVQGDYGGVHLRARAWAAATPGLDRGPRQRLVFVAGSDPYAELGNPFLRSRGALLTRTALPYLNPGLGGLRGLDPALAARNVIGVTAEVERDVLHARVSLFRRVAVALFADVGGADGDVHPASPGRMAVVADAGVGFRADHHLGTTVFQTRVDLPLWVSVPSLARRGQERRDRVAFRWTVAFAPSF